MVEDIHSPFPNHHTLLSVLFLEPVIYTVLDLKYDFFSLQLAPTSQPMFAYKWTDSEDRFNGLLTWTQLPLGFKNSTTIFDEALCENLGDY